MIINIKSNKGHNHSSITVLSLSLAKQTFPRPLSLSVKKHCRTDVAEISIIDRYTDATTKAINPETKVTEKGELSLCS